MFGVEGVNVVMVVLDCLWVRWSNLGIFLV